MSSASSSPIVICGYSSPRLASPSVTVPYQRLQSPKETFVAFVTSIKDPLNLHLDIYFPAHIEARYSKALSYEYKFLSEECSGGPGIIQTRKTYVTHLKGIELIADENYRLNSKAAYIYLMQHITVQGGWVLCSVGDTDIHLRLLVNIFDVITKVSINKSMLSVISPRTGKPVVKRYTKKEHVSQESNVPKAEQENRGFTPSNKEYHLVLDK
ncbi:MAG: hypothetical protein Solivirus3_5 [Solivirus sp.]|uniref:Uncharacterized protein n=1 Tax=Solivirus sp. TaxID=2487772 RepID=A0A3G5AFK8_9VIRU|nr:MAG: hypothetical protein Solivirus3_5 [Solivirus sp.]